MTQYTRGDWVSGGTALIAAGITYLVGGTKPALWCIAVGAIIVLVVHLTGKKDGDNRAKVLDGHNVSLNDSFNAPISQTANPTLTANPTININLPLVTQANNANEAQTVSGRTSEVRPGPNLIFVRPTASRLTPSNVGPEVLTKSESGMDSAVIIVSNDPSGSGAAPVHHVTAQIVFRDSGEEIYGGTAAWVGRFETR